MGIGTTTRGDAKWYGVLLVPQYTVDDRTFEACVLATIVSTTVDPKEHGVLLVLSSKKSGGTLRRYDMRDN